MQNLLKTIEQAGIVGCGGAGFPTHIKLSGDIKHLIINGIECEPLLFTDKYIMEHFPEKLVEALTILKKELSIEKCTIATKETYEKQIAALRGAIDKSGVDIELFLSRSYYPAGDEQSLVYDVTGEAIKPQKIPLSLGCAVLNVGTLLAIYDAVVTNKPFESKFLTVAGEVSNACVINVRLGTPFSKCIELAGGHLSGDCVIVSGGPMMGKRYSFEEGLNAKVEKTTSGILILPRREYQSDVEKMLATAKAACIQCMQCTELCPRYLLGHPLFPHKIMRKMAYSGGRVNVNDPTIQSAALCCECGVCEVYACPMQLLPRRINAMIKKELKAAEVKPSFEGQQVHDLRGSRLAPTERVAARAAVGKYYNKP